MAFWILSFRSQHGPTQTISKFTKPRRGSSFLLAPRQCTPRIPGASFYSGNGLQFGDLHGPLNHLCVLVSLPATSPEPSTWAWSWWNSLPGKTEPRLSSTHQGFTSPQHFKGNGTGWGPHQDFCLTLRGPDCLLCGTWSLVPVLIEFTKWHSPIMDFFFFFFGHTTQHMELP